MQSLTTDDALATGLAQAKELVELRDRAGRILGYFAPLTLEGAAGYAEAAAQLAKTKSQQKSTAPGPARTTAEVLAHLESLGK